MEHRITPQGERPVRIELPGPDPGAGARAARAVSTPPPGPTSITRSPAGRRKASSGWQSRPSTRWCWPRAFLSAGRGGGDCEGGAIGRGRYQQVPRSHRRPTRCRPVAGPRRGPGARRSSGPAAGAMGRLRTASGAAGPRKKACPGPAGRAPGLAPPLQPRQPGRTLHDRAGRDVERTPRPVARPASGPCVPGRDRAPDPRPRRSRTRSARSSSARRTSSTGCWSACCAAATC